ncbi:Serine/threonine protein kinase [Singulisphaera sp. GP187]|uniref:serine/threonine protein kinase n=1 Tax=Singulisphaera sp. GP187 TaxID=1882752 RepID=UPI000926DA22|nr:serine/threonine-protein kinase [Singulisphaera sp. GP187]SIN91260.1 Serine/threonine protein kinase [Singulisphaera sp. GP187]
MDLIIALFQAYSAVKDVALVSGSVSDWVVDVVSKWSLRNSTEKIERQVGKIATVTDADIRRAAAEAFLNNSHSRIPEAKREELIGMMLNMARNVRQRSACGPMDSSYFRSERLLELLLLGVEPIRHQGESVAPGSPWVLRRHLGMGSFGEVWMAENRGYPTPRAFKFFTNDRSGEWLRREQNSLVAILKRLGEHDHIVDFEDVQTEDCEYPYLALEYLGGGSLEEWIVKDRAQRPRLEPHEIIRQVVSGLAAAHAKEIAHRDIKPANILLTEGADPRIKIGDFGLAKVVDSKRDGGSQLASLVGVVGTGLYLPPEAQQRGAKRKATQDDVFALGVVWYQLVVGAIERPPYDFAERLRSKELDSHSIGLIERCLAHPDRRFVDAREVEAALTDVVPPIRDYLHGDPDVQHLAREYLSTLSR